MRMPSKTQRQADFFQHCAHDELYARHRSTDQGVAKAVHQEDIDQGLFGKTVDGPCPKCEELAENAAPIEPLEEEL